MFVTMSWVETGAEGPFSRLGGWVMEKGKAIDRGSAKVFGASGDDHESLAHALGLARGDFLITRWHKIGLPPFERIDAEFQVSPAQLGPTVAKLMQLNTPNLLVTAECFPYGIVNPEYRVEVSLEKSE